ncbi:hypothetical protein Cadr_000011634 [Camelus dromedarius]|uniref:Uncharacterized protein n=1 Tax=Camelus dromedarius TaxID=9838 RepID=A0A5N4DQ35_CAMDR|nr:hypothetical protein Cadr_000011634 [Camelus dromedarius]
MWPHSPHPISQGLWSCFPLSSQIMLFRVHLSLYSPCSFHRLPLASEEKPKCPPQLPTPSPVITLPSSLSSLPFTCATIPFLTFTPTGLFPSRTHGRFLCHELSAQSPSSLR